MPILPLIVGVAGFVIAYSGWRGVDPRDVIRAALQGQPMPTSASDPANTPLADPKATDRALKDSLQINPPGKRGSTNRPKPKRPAPSGNNFEDFYRGQLPEGMWESP